MFTILGLMLVLYSLTNWAEHRVLSAFLLFGALLTLAAPGRAPLVLVAALIVSNVATAGTFVRVFEAKRQEQFIWDHRGVNVLQETLEANRVVYRKDQSRWCNTLLTAQEPPHLIAVPAGIGISVVRESDQMSMPPRSRYLLLDESALAHFQRPVRVQPLGDTAVRHALPEPRIGLRLIHPKHGSPFGPDGVPTSPRRTSTRSEPSVIETLPTSSYRDLK